MLSTLHDTLHDSHGAWWNIFPHSHTQFRFFVLHHLGRIRFFLEVPIRHRHFLESQLYAHYSDIEITEAVLPFSPDAQISVQEARLSHISPDTIKLYANLKDRTEKESIDPLSSITSVLSKSVKDETVFLRIDFSPLSDHEWREHSGKAIIESPRLPDILKLFLLANWWWIQIFVFPFTLFAHIASFLTGALHNKDEYAISDKKESREKQEGKFETYGYSVQILLASLGKKTTTTRELSSSLNIFSQPNGAKLVT